MKKLTQITLLGSASLLVAGAGTAYAATSAAAPPPVIHACKANRGGAVRIVGRTVRCKRGETRVTWNQRGAAGPRGPVGPSNAYFSRGATTTLAAGAYTKVGGLRLPAGSYVINSSVVAQYSAGWVFCKWSHGPFSGSQAGPNTGQSGSVVDTLAATTAVALSAPTTVTLDCYASSAASAFVPMITATRAGSLTITTPHGPLSGQQKLGPHGIAR